MISIFDMEEEYILKKKYIEIRKIIDIYNNKNL